MKENGADRRRSNGHADNRAPALDPAHLRAEIARLRTLKAESVDDIDYELELVDSGKKFAFGKRKFRQWVEGPSAVPGSINEANSLVDSVSDLPDLIVPLHNLSAAANSVRDLLAAAGGFFEWGAPAKIVESTDDDELPQTELLTIDHVVDEVQKRRRVVDLTPGSRRRRRSESASYGSTSSPRKGNGSCRGWPASPPRRCSATMGAFARSLATIRQPGCIA